MTTELKLYRKRFIPDEVIYLKDDIILYADSQLVITKWDCLHPRKDIARGYSAYDLHKGFKVNKVYNSNSELVYWYCDIIRPEYNIEANALIVTDLLVDILVYPDSSSKVLDLDEVADALESNLISVSLASEALRKAHSLLNEIYEGTFSAYQALINQYEDCQQ